jgi:hypothetical protein
LAEFHAKDRTVPPRQRLQTLASDFRKDDLWATKVGFYMLWFEYLALSPSYELARQFRASRLSAEQQGQLPKDFERVLEVYDDFGDVQRQLFLPWWRETGMPLCGYQGKKPRVTKVAAIGRKKSDRATIAEHTTAFLDEQWLEQGQQNTLLVAIPIGLPKSRIAKELGALIDKYPKHAKSLSPPKPKYGLAGKRQNKEMLFRYMHVLLGRAAMPQHSLWRVGVRTGVSETYSPELDADAKVVRNDDTHTYDRMMLSILTSRAIHRAKMISENAARGIFPSYKNCEHAVEIDFDQLYKRFAARERWKKRQTAKASK